jgi:hypothetical protein
MYVVQVQVILPQPFVHWTFFFSFVQGCLVEFVNPNIFHPCAICMKFLLLTRFVRLETEANLGLTMLSRGPDGE